MEYFQYVLMFKSLVRFAFVIKIFSKTELKIKIIFKTEELL